MATSNTNITKDWTKVADSDDEIVLITWNSPVEIEFATTAADEEPTVEGHMLNHSDALTRAVIGDGYIWAKLRKGTYINTVSLVVSK